MRTWLICIVVLTVQACAWRSSIPTIPQVELHRSQSQELIVVNNTGSTVHLLDDDGSAELTDGEFLKIMFVVISVAELHEAEDGPWWIPNKDAIVNYFRETGDIKFTKQQGLDITIQYQSKTTENMGPVTPVLVNLSNCPQGEWQDGAAAPAEHPVNLMQLPGIPTRICPR